MNPDLPMWITAWTNSNNPQTTEFSTVQFLLLLDPTEGSGR